MITIHFFLEIGSVHAMCKFCLFDDQALHLQAGRSVQERVVATRWRSRFLLISFWEFEQQFCKNTRLAQDRLLHQSSQNW